MQVKTTFSCHLYQAQTIEEPPAPYVSYVLHLISCSFYQIYKVANLNEYNVANGTYWDFLYSGYAIME